MQQHPLQTWGNAGKAFLVDQLQGLWSVSTTKGFLVDQLQGFVVSLHHKGFSVDGCVEAFTAKNDSQEFALNVGVLLLGLCQGFAGKGYRSSDLEKGRANSNLWCVYVDGG